MVYVNCHCNIKTGEVIFSEVPDAHSEKGWAVIDTNVKALGLSIQACEHLIEGYKKYKNDPGMQAQIKKNVPQCKKKLARLIDWTREMGSLEKINAAKRINYKKFYKLQQKNKNII